MTVDTKGSVSVPEPEEAYVGLANRTRGLFDLSIAQQRDSHFWVDGYTLDGFQAREITVEIKGQPDPLIHIRRVQGARGTTTIQLRHNIVSKYGSLEWGRSSLRVDPQDAQPISFDELNELYKWLEHPDFENGIGLMTRLEKLPTP